MKENAIKVLAIGTILLLMFMAFSIMPLNAGAVSKSSSTPTLWATVQVEEAILATDCIGENPELDANPTELPELTPYWVDIVDAENGDVSNFGEGVYIAVLDTGLVNPWKNYLDESQFALEYAKGFSHDVTWDSELGDFVWGDLKDDRGYLTGMYGHGHGTHVASTITGFKLSAYDGWKWIRGVAPHATIIPVLVLDTWFLACPDPEYLGCHKGYVKFAGGTWEMIAAGINYVADLAADELKDNPVIISMSLGGYEENAEVEAAINKAIKNGVIVVAAAGNEGEYGMTWPGAYPQVISCAAGGWSDQWANTPSKLFWRNDTKDVPEKLKTEDYHGNDWQIFLNDFSSRVNHSKGQQPWHLDVTAPGTTILGPYKNPITWYGEPYNNWYNFAPNWYWVSGTSMATPHVSAIVSIILHEMEEDIEESKCPKKLTKFKKNRQFAVEMIVKLAALGPLPTHNATIFTDRYWNEHTHTWKRKDWGNGWLEANQALCVYNKIF